MDTIADVALSQTVDKVMDDPLSILSDDTVATNSLLYRNEHVLRRNVLHTSRWRLLACCYAACLIPHSIVERIIVILFIFTINFAPATNSRIFLTQQNSSARYVWWVKFAVKVITFIFFKLGKICVRQTVAVGIGKISMWLFICGFWCLEIDIVSLNLVDTSCA